KFNKVSELEGKSVALDQGRRAHVRLYFERSCEALGKQPNQFYREIINSPNAEQALDGVVDGTVQAAVVDCAALECYERLKPSRFANLKELARSPAFPDPVIAYRAGAIDEKTAKQFRAGMLDTGNKVSGREMMTLWKVTGFAAVPEDYEKILQAIAKRY